MGDDSKRGEESKSKKQVDEHSLHINNIPNKNLRYEFSHISKDYNIENIQNGQNSRFSMVNGDPLLPLAIGKQTVAGLIDTGCNFSVINHDIFQQLSRDDYEYLQIPKDTSATLADGSKIPLIGYVRLSIKLEGRKYTLEAYICRDISYQLILGTNFFAKHHINISFSDFKLSKEPSTRIRMSDSYTIPPYTKVTVYTYVASLPNGTEATFEPSPVWRKLGCLVPRQLVKIDHQKPYIPVEIINCTGRAFKIQKHRVLGQLETLLSFQTPIGPIGDESKTDEDQSVNRMSTDKQGNQECY